MTPGSVENTHFNPSLPSFTDLPHEITTMFFLLIPHQEILKLHTVCKVWHQILNCDLFWKQYTVSQLPNLRSNWRLSSLAWLEIRQQLFQGIAESKIIDSCLMNFSICTDDESLVFQKDQSRMRLNCWNLKTNKYFGQIGIKNAIYEVKSFFCHKRIICIAYQEGEIGVYKGLKFLFSITSRESSIQGLKQIFIVNNYIYISFLRLNDQKSYDFYQIPLIKSGDERQRKLSSGELQFFKKENALGWMNHSNIKTVIEGEEKAYTFPIQDKSLQDYSRIRKDYWLFIYRNGHLEFRNDYGKLKSEVKRLPRTRLTEQTTIQKSLILKSSFLTLKSRWEGSKQMVLSLWKISSIKCTWSIEFEDFIHWKVFRNLLFTHHENSTLKVWDLYTGKCCQIFKNVRSTIPVQYVAGKFVFVSSNGKLIATKTKAGDKVCS